MATAFTIAEAFIINVREVDTLSSIFKGVGGEVMKRIRTKAVIWSALISCALIAASDPARSADLEEGLDTEAVEPAPAARGWTLDFATYAWLPWLSGNVAVRGRPLDVELSPGDVIDALDWSGIPVWMSYMELSNGRFALFNDIVYSKLAGSDSFEATRQGRIATLGLSGNVEADYTQTTIELGAAYEVWSSAAAVAGERTSLDVLGGGRYWSQEVNVSADVAATLNVAGPLGIVDLERSGSRVLAQSGSVDWIDPFIGMRLTHDFAPGQTLMVRGDIGGFGAGSDFSWQAMANYNWQMLRNDRYAIDAFVGYRALDVDYSEGTGNTRYEYDVLQHGPVMGMTMKF